MNLYRNKATTKSHARGKKKESLFVRQRDKKSSRKENNGHATEKLTG